ncbi:MAG: DUF3800 domain-containing protein [Thaumarchaeota archaeon]|nr:DUF3800 domain-containing protein [Nitrososphaerota archaeon]
MATAGPGAIPAIMAGGGRISGMTGTSVPGVLPGRADLLRQAPRAASPAGLWTLYADSSGNARRRDGPDAYYTLGCLTGSPEALAELARMVYALKLGLVPERDPGSWEVHSVRITHGRKYYQLRPRTRAKRLAVFGAFVRLICESDAVLFGVAIGNERAYREFGSNANVMDMAWTLLLERFELFLRDQGKGRLGCVISDKTGGADMQQIHALVSGSMRLRNPISGVRALHVAGIEFVDSFESLLVQVADVIAYIISRYINGDESFGEMARRLLDKMWVSGGGRHRGWKTVGIRAGAAV